MFLHSILTLLRLDFSTLRYYLLSFCCGHLSFTFLCCYSCTTLPALCLIYIYKTILIKSIFYMFWYHISEDSSRKTNHSWYFTDYQIIERSGEHRSGKATCRAWEKLQSLIILAALNTKAANLQTIENCCKPHVCHLSEHLLIVPGGSIMASTFYLLDLEWMLCVGGI